MSRYLELSYMLYNHFFENDQVARTDNIPRSRYTTWKSDNNQIYTCVEGETFRNLAFTFYGDEKFWWIIADVNPQVNLREGAFGLNAGELIEIPPRSFLP